MKLPIENRDSISSISAANILLGIQSGFFVILLPQLLANETGKMAWLYLLGAGFWSVLIIFCIFKLTTLTGMNWRELNHIVFGRWLGIILEIIWLMSLVGTNAYIIQKYVRFIKLFEFPNVQPIFYIILMVAVATFTVYGGLHTISSIFFVSYSLQMLLLAFCFISIYSDIQWKYITPFTAFENPANMRTLNFMFASLAGLEISVLLFRYIRPEDRSGISRIFSIVSIIGTITMISIVEVCMSVFGLDLLKVTPNASITLMRLVKLPIIEQLDQVGVGLLLIRILPIVSMYLWSSNELFRGIAPRKLPFQYHLIIQAVLLLAVAFGFMPFRISSNMDTIVMGVTTTWFVIYAPILIIFAWLRTSFRLHKRIGG